MPNDRASLVRFLKMLGHEGQTNYMLHLSKIVLVIFAVINLAAKENVFIELEKRYRVA